MHVHQANRQLFLNDALYPVSKTSNLLISKFYTTSNFFPSGLTISKIFSKLAFKGDLLHSLYKKFHLFLYINKHNPPPPRLPALGKVTAKENPTATAASIALPPSLKSLFQCPMINCFG